MNRNLKLLALTLAASAPVANAQLSDNPDKFLGNITTRGSVNGGGIEFATLWNQLTPENESKWASIEGSKDRFNWGGCDACYNYCRAHGFPFKFHTLVWGSQYPSWMDDLAYTAQLTQITQWMDAIAERYPDLDLIDVVNEAVPGHAPAPYREALGGAGVTGYDWIIKAFQMAHERWPNAILIYNDYNTFQWQRQQFIDLVTVLRDAGAPIDAYGCQSHDLTDMNFTAFKSAMQEIQSALRIPMYSSEYDIGTADDQLQLRQYSDQIKYMWECDYVAGITLWGYMYGMTWTTDGNSGIIRNGQDRPAMKWLREYMASEDARTAKSPFPGMKKPHSIYIRPLSWRNYVDEPATIVVDATLAEGEIDRVELYVKNNRIGVATEYPYEFEYQPTAVGTSQLIAHVYDKEGNRYRRYGGLHVFNHRSPFNGEIVVPGIVEAEDFDKGGEGLSYHDTDSRNEGGTSYRPDAPGVDIVGVPGGYALGYTSAGEWLEYTIDIQQDGRYNYIIHASTQNDNAAVSLKIMDGEEVFTTTNKIEIPNTGSWNTYTTVKGHFSRILRHGTQVLRLNFDEGACNIDKIELECYKAGIEDMDKDIESVYQIFNTQGMYLGTTDAVTDNELPHAIYQLTGTAGIYVARDVETGEGRMIKASAF